MFTGSAGDRTESCGIVTTKTLGAAANVDNMSVKLNTCLIAAFFMLILTCGHDVFRVGINAAQTEVDLHEQLFERYNPNIMPRNSTLPIVVGIEMHLLSIDNIDEKRQTISVRAFLEVTWQDAFLQWVPEDYGNVTSINVKVEDIWTPDLALENTFDSPTNLGQEKGNANIDYNGHVIMWPYKTYTVSCKIYIADFPFDEQTCTFQFLSWTNTISVLKLDNKSRTINVNTYRESGEWDLVQTNVVHFQRSFGSEFWDLMRFQIKVKRKWLFHVMNLIVPVLCISVLNIVCFLLPSEGGERVTLSISIFLTLAVFLSIVNSSMPESSDEVAKFGVYVGLQLLGSALTIILTTISLYIFHRNESIPICKGFRFFVKMSCITLPKQQRHSGEVSCHVATLCEDVLKNGIHTKSEVETANINPLPPQNNIDKSYEPDITWKLVSRALDRFGFTAAVVWHILLILILFSTTVS